MASLGPEMNPTHHYCLICFRKLKVKGTGGSVDPKIGESALLSLNYHSFSNTELSYTK